MKEKAVNKQFHTSKSKIGMGDSYGTGNKAPLGKMKEGMGQQVVSLKKLKKPPKSLA